MKQVGHLSKGSSAVSNGSRLHDQGVDGRSAPARRFRDAYRAFCRNIGPEPDEADKALARQAAALTVQAETLQAQIAAGADVDADALVRTSNALARLLMAGRKAKAKPRDAAPSIGDYLRENYGHAASTEAGDSDLLAGDAETAS